MEQKSIWMFPLFLFALFLLCSSVTFAQFDQQGLSISPQAGASNFRFAEPNELTIVVSIMGSVQNPGRYEVSLNINLLDLIALAGGWTELADETDITLTRLVHSSTGLERKELRFDFSDLAAVKDNQLGLQQGDIVFVPASSALTFDDILRYVTALLVTVTAAITIANN